ncbi:protein mono-ADP-ribosyltransferase TIPARP [Kryptolebias marmoratus]|uniref:protein mono-ADP-ribosyltransferase TIPARP n=1 Tax=Kryptolebias marmoratus TaxID=37003 RepID=UPI000D52F344|nr:protein mono-ADP-ribosyltransferase TIPARP [Kryptolebias marmoratus]
MFKMAGILSGKGTKRKFATQPVAPELESRPSRVTMLSSSLLRFEIPADINTSLPVWDAVRSQKVVVAWTVDPYSISVHLTPEAPRQRNAAAARKGKSTPGVAQTSRATVTQQHGSSQSAPCVLLTFSQSPFAVSSAAVPLPLIITYPQRVLPDVAPPSATQLSASAPGELQAEAEAAEPLPFHTRSSPDVYICDDFLLGACGAGAACELHHTPYPFHWQLWSTSAHRWEDLPPRAQALLERIYCDADQENVYLKDGQVCYTLSFDSMELDDLSKYDGVRRLTNSDSAIRNPHFPSQLKLYWWNDNNFQEYKTDLSDLLLRKMSEKETACSFHINQREYRVDFTTMMQTNALTGFQREVRCRPAYRSPRSMQPHLKTGIQVGVSQPDSGPPGSAFSVNPLEEFTSWYPPVWLRPAGEDYSLVDVPIGTRAHRTVEDLFHESLSETSMEIVSIQQVQNLFHWDKYQRQKAHMQKQHSKSKEPLEKHLFHGTTKDASESICRNNFDPRVAGLNGTSLGYGTYFATTARQSNAYTGTWGLGGVHHMFLAKVLVGRTCPGKQHYRRPPPLNSRTQQHVLYNACVDSKDHPSMFVVFDSCQTYPYFLIKYKEFSREVNVRD